MQLLTYQMRTKSEAFSSSVEALPFPPPKKIKLCACRHACMGGPFPLRAGPYSRAGGRSSHGRECCASCMSWTEPQRPTAF